MPATKKLSLGFSILEILLVITIVSILMTLAVANVQDLTNRTAGIKCSQNLRLILAAKADYAMENPGGGSPTSPAQIQLFQSYFPEGFTNVCDRCPSDGTLYTNVYDIYTIPVCLNNTPYNAVLSNYPYSVNANAPNYQVNGYHNLGNSSNN
jgi:prepilin-type N-terminal cleavage/methylation domain-containing protein